MRRCGVNSEAEISEPRSFDQNSMALVIATDGLWDLPKVTAEGVSATLSRWSLFTILKAARQLLKMLTT